MRKIKVVLGASLLLLVSGQVNASLIEYDLSATMYSSESGDLVTRDVVGSLFMDEPMFIQDSSRHAFFTYNIPFFVINIADYQYHGDGVFYSQLYADLDGDFFIAECDSCGLRSWDGLFGFEDNSANTIFYDSAGTPYKDNGNLDDVLASDFFNLPYRIDSTCCSFLSKFGDMEGSLRDLVIQQTKSVPEPSTVLLLGTGLAGLGFARRRRILQS